MSELSFTKANLRDDVADLASPNGIEGLKAHFAADTLGLQQTGISDQRLDPGSRQPWGCGPAGGASR